MRNGKDTVADMMTNYIKQDSEFVKTIGHTPIIARESLANEVRRMIDSYFTRIFDEVNGVVKFVNMELKSFVGGNSWYDPKNSLGALNSIVTTKDHIWKDKNSISRTMHQAVGEMVRREVKDSHWVETLCERLGRNKNADVTFITDVRWTRDLEYLLDNLCDDYEVVTIHVTRTKFNQTEKDKDFLKDTSENSLDFNCYNHRIESSSLEELYKKTAEIYINTKKLLGGGDAIKKI